MKKVLVLPKVLILSICNASALAATLNINLLQINSIHGNITSIELDICSMCKGWLNFLRVVGLRSFNPILSRLDTVPSHGIVFLHIKSESVISHNEPMCSMSRITHPF
ncbi:hypothetical protein EV702DRAFT_1051650 [Suillus placidus]|uniref:Secreted protein n=1 Tax=Suillus placidus TaxID=48579 RepID=A0A9P6ZFY4_9AGAM|nr:hypothetical protein EV702DRAFT_1051650 [Suillus placidus]